MSYKQESFSEDRQIAIRNAAMQYNNWRSWGHPDWAIEWMNYHDELCSSTNQHWKKVAVPMNYHNPNFVKSDRQGVPKTYNRASRVQACWH